MNRENDPLEKKELQEFLLKSKDEIIKSQQQIIALLQGNIARLSKFKRVVNSALLCSMMTLGFGIVFLRSQKNHSSGVPQHLMMTPPKGYLDTLLTYQTDSSILKSLKDILKFKDSISLDIVTYKGNFLDIPDSLQQYILSQPLQFLTDTVPSQMLRVVEDDYMHHRTFLQAFSEKIIGISSQDAYTEKIYKIQKFIGQDITYKHDLNYFSKNGSYMTDYQLPGSLTLILKSGDCNNKTGLFVELCRVNGILSAIAFVPGHTFPLVGYKSKDLEKGHIRPVYTSGDYAYIPIESTSSDWPIGEISDQHIPYMRSENIYPFRPL